MFDAVLNRGNVPPSRFGTGATVSILFHVATLALVLWVSTHSRAQTQEVAVKFMLPPPPPSPPPPALKRATTPKSERKVARKPDAITQPREMPKTRPQEAEPEVNNQSDENEGGVEGGVQGGVVGGVVGGTPGGAVQAQSAPKNVPAFSVQRDVIRQPKPHLSDVFIQGHKNRGPISGIYKICVGQDGHVFEVAPVKAIPGADEDIVQGIRDWLYKPRQVPVCFLYNFAIVLQ